VRSRRRSRHCDRESPSQRRPSRASSHWEAHRFPGRCGGRPGSQETCLRPKPHQPSRKGGSDVSTDLALAALLVLLRLCVALGAPVTVQLRVEGATSRSSKGPVTTDGHAVDGGDGTGVHPCDGTQRVCVPRAQGPRSRQHSPTGVGRETGTRGTTRLPGLPDRHDRARLWQPRRRATGAPC